MPPGSSYSGTLGSDICSPPIVEYTSRIMMQEMPARVIIDTGNTSIVDKVHILRYGVGGGPSGEVGPSRWRRYHGSHTGDSLV